MATDDSEQPIEPGNGRIIGAGSNNLQRSIDSLNTTVQRLLTSPAGGSGGSGRPPVAVALGSASPAPRGPSGALVPRGDRFPVPVSWDANDSGTSMSYEWGSPVRNPAPQVHSANRQAIASAPETNGWQWAHTTDSSLIQKDGPPSSGGFNARSARRWINRVRNFGNSQLKQALPMDNYAQFAALQAGSPYGPNSSVNAIRKSVYGSQGSNQIMWAQNVQDATNALYTASRDSGFTAVSPQFQSYLGGIKDLSILNPTMNAADTANVMGTLASTRGLYSSMMFGYKPVLGPGGQVNRNALGAFTDSVMRSAYGKSTVSAKNLAASLGQNGVLNSNIQAYVTAAGGDQTTVQALEDYITGRNTAMQKGVSGADFDKLLSTYEAGGSGSSAAGNRLKKLGINNSILQSQKTLSASKAENTSDLLDSFGPAIKKANDALADFYGVLDKIVGLPGLNQLLGYGAAFGSVFGGAASTIVGGIGGYTASRAATSALTGAAGSGAATTLAGRAAAIGTSTAALGGAAVFLASAAGNEHWSKSEAKVKAYLQWERETYHLSEKQQGRETGKVGDAHRKVFDKIWDQAQKEQAAGRTTGTDGIGGGASAASGGGAAKGSSGSPSSGNVITGKNAAGAISAALSQLGKPYQWGGTGPDSWDCSGLMQYAYGTIGVRLPRTSEQQMNVGQPVDRKDVRPGDLMFPYAGHVVMYIGGGKIVEAPRTGENVRTASVNEYGRYAAIRRIVGSVGSLSGIDTGKGGAGQKQMADNLGGDSGSQVMGAGNYGSVEEVDAISSALASGASVGSSQPQGSSSSSANDSGGTTAATSSGPWKKDSSGIARAKSLGKAMAAQLYNWTGREWDSLDKLFTGESGWRWWADNPSSHAYGIVQSLPGSKMASAGKDWKTNPATQLKWGLKYIHDRYGDPNNAYSTWSQRSPHWYNTGAWNIPDDQMAMVHKGEMIIEKPKAETIRNALMSDVMNVKDAATGSTSKGSGQGLTLVFDKNSVCFTVGGVITESQAQAAGTAFVQAIASDERLKSLARGL